MRGQESGWTDVAIGPSRIRSLALVGLSAGFVLVGAAMGIGALPGIGPWSAFSLVGWVCVVFFSLAGIMWLNLAMTGGPVVMIGPLGIRDTRLSPDWIPWTAITGIGETTVQNQSFITLRIDPAFEASMPLTRMARWTKPMNAALGFSGCHVSAIGLKGGFAALRQAVLDGSARAR